MEIKEVKTKKSIDAELIIPGSKSYANRALIISALTNGKSVLKNMPSCDDVSFMISALKLFGVTIEQIDLTTYSVLPPKKLEYSGEIYVGSAGTTMRFLTSFCCLGFGDILLKGNDRMHQRPIEDLIAALETNIDGSITVKNKTNNGERCPPLKIKSKGLFGGKMKLKGDTSSQYLTSILLSAPYCVDSLNIEIIGDLTSKSYADITIDVMEKFGVNVTNNNYETFLVPIKKYNSCEYYIESDASGVSYFLAVAAITKGKIKINNLNPNSVQGDIKFIDLLEKMGCKIEKGKDYLFVEGPEKLNAIEVDMNSMPDTAQTLAVIASVAEGSTKITGIANLRVKETDRIGAMVNELKKVGIKAEAGEDYLIVHGGEPTPAQIATYDDHRMAMSFAVLGAKVSGIKIENPSCVSKSFPEFWELFEKL